MNNKNRINIDKFAWFLKEALSNKSDKAFLKTIKKGIKYNCKQTIQQH